MHGFRNRILSGRECCQLVGCLIGFLVERADAGLKVLLILRDGGEPVG